MAKFYTMESPDKLWLNTDYHTVARMHTHWLPEGKKRLYKSVKGIRSALRHTLLTGMTEALNLPPIPTFRMDMTVQERDTALKLRFGRYKKLKSLSFHEWVDLCERLGYKIHEVDV